MRKYLWLVIVVLIGWMISFYGCDEMDEMMEPVMTDPEIVVDPVTILIYAGSSWWITPSDAAVEAETTKSRLQSHGIPVQITSDSEYVRDWMLHTNNDGIVNVLILYGVIPTSIYPAGNTQPDGSVAENWIETSDGNTILNHADYLGWNTQADPFKSNLPPDEWRQTTFSVGTNEWHTLQNLMDLPNITFNTDRNDIPMFVTEDGKALTPSLAVFESDRSFPLDQLQGDWFAEKIFASNTGDARATLADPVIVRDGNRGRLAIIHQTEWADNPKGEVAAEIIINYLLQDPIDDISRDPIDDIPPEPVVTFPDANLASKVRQAINLPAGAAISEAQLATLIVLDVSASPDVAPQEKISDLTGLEHATQLTEINLQFNQIKDISPLAGLTQLTRLVLNDNQITDINPLGRLRQLTTLVLDDNQIKDLSSLAQLRQLTTLGLRNNQIKDISPLTRLRQLTTLDLYGNKISNVRPLSGLVNLDFLFLTGNPITDKSPLQTLLEKNSDVEIDIGETIWMPDSNLRDAVREELRLAPNVPITRRSMQRLTELAAAEGLEPLPLHNQIKNLTGLEYATQLQLLLLSGNQIQNISPLAGLTQLKELYLGWNQIQDISPLAGLTQLEQLVLQDNQIRDVSPLVDLTQLEKLRLWRNPIQDIEPLRVLVDKIFGKTPPDSFLDIQIYLPE